MTLDIDIFETTQVAILCSLGREGEQCNMHLRQNYDLDGPTESGPPPFFPHFISYHASPFFDSSGHTKHFPFLKHTTHARASEPFPRLFTLPAVLVPNVLSTCSHNSSGGCPSSHWRRFHTLLCVEGNALLNHSWLPHTFLFLYSEFSERQRTQTFLGLRQKAKNAVLRNGL